MKDFFCTWFFSGIELICQKDSKNIRQKTLIKRLLQINKKTESKQKINSINSNPNQRQHFEHIGDKNKATRYHCILCSLLNIAVKTRPDFCLCATFLGLHVERPCIPDLISANRAVQCSKGTLERSFMLRPGRENQKVLS